MADVFLSYSRADSNVGREVVERIEEARFSVWWDERIFAQSNWDDAIETELSAAKAVLVLWTPSAVMPGSFVRKEAMRAERYGKLIPTKVIACELPVTFETTQFIDLCDWDRLNPRHKSWRLTLDRIGELVGRPPNDREAIKAAKLRDSIRRLLGE